MHPIIRNLLAVVAGIIIGSLVNAGLVGFLPTIIGTPEGVDMNDLESIKANIGNFELKHFMSPFLAHALGTLVAAFIAARFGATRHLLLALTPGFFFLLGGLGMVVLLPESPLWFKVLDLGLAYMPAAYLGYLLSGQKAH